MSSISSHDKDKSSKKKDKEKPVKVVIRRLPRDMTWAELEEQLAPLPPVEYVSFVPADTSLDPHAFARCYLAFGGDSAAVIDFSNRFNRYVFVDSRGNESMALVELAMYHRVPRKRREDVGQDTRCGIIEQETEYQKFMDDLESTGHVSVLTIEEQLQHISLLESVAKASAVQETPLTQYIVKKNDEKYKRVEDRRRQRVDERRLRRDRERDRFEKDKLDKDKKRKEQREREARATTSTVSADDRNTSSPDLDEKRVDWEKFKRGLGIGISSSEGGTATDGGGEKENVNRGKGRPATADDTRGNPNDKANARVRNRPPRVRPPRPPREEMDKKKNNDERERDPHARPPRTVKEEREKKNAERDRAAPGGDRTFARSAAARPERTTAASRGVPADKKDKNKKDRPERELYRPGQRVRNGGALAGGSNASATSAPTKTTGDNTRGE